jgi:hypothetical protein
MTEATVADARPDRAVGVEASGDAAEARRNPTDGGGRALARRRRVGVDLEERHKRQFDPDRMLTTPIDRSSRSDAEVLGGARVNATLLSPKMDRKNEACSSISAAPCLRLTLPLPLPLPPLRAGGGGRGRDGVRMTTAFVFVFAVAPRGGDADTGFDIETRVIPGQKPRVDVRAGTAPASKRVQQKQQQQQEQTTPQPRRILFPRNPA